MIARLLAAAAALAATALGIALLRWTGRREHWLWRPEHLFLLLLGLVALRVLLAPRPVPSVRPRRVGAVGVGGPPGCPPPPAPPPTNKLNQKTIKNKKNERPPRANKKKK